MNNVNRGLRRELKGWQIYFITIGGIIGIGFFTNAGEVLAVAGPGGTVVAFFIVGLIAFCVMEGICEMIVLWPIPNAMVEFVRTFVDEDLAVVIGAGYCALIISTANLASYWDISAGLKSTMFALAPIILVILNLFWVEVFGWIEAIGGLVKLGLVAFVFVLMLLVNRGAIGDQKIGTRNWQTFIETNTAVANSKAEAIMIAIPQVTFAYIGVELLTTTAYEAQDASQLKLTAMFIVLQVCILYVAIAAAFVSNVGWNDPRLPQLFRQFAAGSFNNSTIIDAASPRSSALPIIALIETNCRTLASVLTAILMYSGLSAANTALYVASRTLYGFARNFEVTEQSSWYRRTFHGLSTVLPWTGAPLWGVIAPAALLCWLPFIHLSEDSTKQLLQEVLLNIGSVSAVLVWFSQCIAYICYWRLRDRHQLRITSSNDEGIRKLLQDSGKNSLLASGQPVWAVLGAIGTFTIVFVFNSVVFWNGKVFTVKFFASFLSPILMSLLFLGLKAKRTRFFTSQTVKHWGVDMSDYKKFELAIQRLNGMIHPASPLPRRKRSLFNLIKRETADVRISPASTGAERPAPPYRPGDFEPIGDEDGTSDDGNYHPSAHGRPEMVPHAIPMPPPQVRVDNEWHELQDQDQNQPFYPREPYGPRHGRWEEI